MTGRPPKPDSLKDLTGSKQPRNAKSPRFRKVESVPVLKFVERDADALEEWTRVLPELIDNGMLTRANLSTFGAYCQAYANWRHAEDDVFENGRMFTVPVFNKKTGAHEGDRQVVNPNISQAQHAMLAMLRIAVEFGLTPAAATRVSAEPGDEKANTFADMVEQSMAEDEAAGERPN